MTEIPRRVLTKKELEALNEVCDIFIKQGKPYTINAYVKEDGGLYIDARLQDAGEDTTETDPKKSS